MRVTIITITDYLNYGNRLQAYALQELLRERGAQVQVGLELFFKEAVLQGREPWKRKIKALLPPMLLDRHDRRLKRQEWPEGRRDRDRRFRRFTRRYIRALPKVNILEGFDVSHCLSPDSADFFIAGSDQVWNPLCCGNPCDFLEFARPEQRLSFAASMGIETLPAEVLSYYREALNGMRYLSVREESAARIVRELTGREADVTPDPTLLLPVEKWRELEKKPAVRLPERYILSFFLGERPPAVEKFSREKSLPVVYLEDLRYPELYALDPAEFLYVLNRAEYVLTDSFHGAAFSIKFHRDFYVFRRRQEGMEDMFTRIADLLERFDLAERSQERDQITPAPAVPEERWREIDKALDAERGRSMERLFRAME